MIPAGYMAKRVSKKPDWLKTIGVIDIYSVSGCISEDFAVDYADYWKHNGFGLFDSPDAIRAVVRENSLQIEGTSLFYYQAYEMEYDGTSWRVYSADPSLPTNVVLPSTEQLEGFDVVTFSMGRRPECSPLSCNSLATTLPTNAHCLFASFREAETNIKDGSFIKCEPGPYRILSVHSVDW